MPGVTSGTSALRNAANNRTRAVTTARDRSAGRTGTGVAVRLRHRRGAQSCYTFRRRHFLRNRHATRLVERVFHASDRSRSGASTACDGARTPGLYVVRILVARKDVALAARVIGAAVACAVARARHRHARPHRRRGVKAIGCSDRHVFAVSVLPRCAAVGAAAVLRPRLDPTTARP